MFEKAKELGCDYIATGHYANTEYSEKYNRWVLKKSKAGRKDQSYVLWSIPKDILSHVLFPLSDFESKDEIRKIALDNNLRVANKPDSEDICFIPDGNYKAFLEENSDIRPKKGKIVHVSGKVLGAHTGLYNYTLGQRKGLGIAYSEPLFVVGFNEEKNEVVVGEQNYLYASDVWVNNINLLLLDEIEDGLEVLVKTRYSSKEAKAKLYNVEDNSIYIDGVEQQDEMLELGVFCGDDVLLPINYSALSLGWAIIPFVVFVFLATTNAVNLTDGLDGLAGGVSFVFFVGVMILLNNYEEISLYSISASISSSGFMCS